MPTAKFGPNKMSWSQTSNEW